MYRVFLADDELLVVEGLKVLINWKELGFEICGSADNGISALEKIIQLKPDAVVTDVRMPGLDGLELIKMISRKLPGTQCIVLSGYRDFEYAREAIEGNAKGYLLKPVNSCELVSILQLIKLELDSRIEKKRERYELEKKLRESMPAIKNRYLNEIISDEKMESNEITRRMDFLGIEYQYESLVLSILEPDFNCSEYLNSIAERQLMLFALMNIVEEILDEVKKGIAFENYKGQIVIIFFSNDSREDFKNEIICLLDRIAEPAEKYLKLKVYAGVSRVFAVLKALSSAYVEAKKALEFRIMEPGSSIIEIEQISMSEDNFSFPYTVEKEMLDLIEMGNFENAAEKFRTILKCITKFDFSADFIYFNCINSITAIMRRLTSLGIDMNTFVSKDEIKPEKVQAFKNMEELMNFMSGIIRRACNAVVEKRSQKMNSTIHEITKYIENNYWENLTLESVAKRFHFNPSYLSQIFKKELNITFLDFLTSIRINEAKKLFLNTDLKVYEIAEKVGYTSQRYFSELFERYIGCKPTAFRKNI